MVPSALFQTQSRFIGYVQTAQCFRCHVINMIRNECRASTAFSSTPWNTPRPFAVDHLGLCQVEEIAPPGAERKEAVQIRLSRSLARHSMTAKLVLHDACCMLQPRLQLDFCHSIFPIRVPSLDSHVPIWHAFMPGVVLYCPILTTRPRPRKSGSRNC